MHLAGRPHGHLQLLSFFHLSFSLLYRRGHLHLHPSFPSHNLRQQQLQTVTLSPQKLLLQFSSVRSTTTAMNTSTPGTSATSSRDSRREAAARAAERRLRASASVAVSAGSESPSPPPPLLHAGPTTTSTTNTTAPVGSTASSRRGTKFRSVSSSDSYGGGDSNRGRGGAVGSRKRKALSAVASAQQVGFSDSDDSDRDATRLRGSKAAELTPAALARGGNKDCAPSAGREAQGNKRGKRSDVAVKTSTPSTAAALGTGVTGRDKEARAAATTTTTSSSSSSSSSSISGVPHTPKTFRVVSWNIDCLSGDNKMSRVEEVCSILLESDSVPDVILLQEVDGDMFPVLNARLGVRGRYRPYPPRVPLGSRYFTIAFVRVATVTVLGSEREAFPASLMGRDLATVRATFNGKPIMVMTSHFESEKQSSDERKAQFKQVLQRLLGFDEGVAIFAGDTNLREAEVKQEKLAKQAGDMWQLCGADPELRFSWDMAKNDNNVFGGGFQPRARYDRMFVNSLAKTSARAFSLLGTQRMAPPESCFPSDHFGIDARFEF